MTWENITCSWNDNIKMYPKEITECWGYLDLKGRRTDRGENCIMMNFITCILHRKLLGWLNQGGWGGRDMWHARRGVYMVLVWRPDGKRPLGRPRHRWEDNIKMDIRDRGIDGANWIRLVQDRVQWQSVVSTVTNPRAP
jgi:hypothetical protein